MTICARCKLSEAQINQYCKGCAGTTELMEYFAQENDLKGIKEYMKEMHAKYKPGEYPYIPYWRMEHACGDAIAKKRLDMVKLIVEECDRVYGTSIPFLYRDWEQKRGHECIYYAAIWERWEILEYLIDYCKRKGSGVYKEQIERAYHLLSFDSQARLDKLTE